MTKSDIANAARWVRDHLAVLTISTVTFAALWLAVGLAELTLFVFDASFYRSLAPPGMELWFQAIGITFRFIVIFGGLAIIWGKQNKMPAAAIGTLRFLFVFSFCAVMVSALGYVSEGGDYHYRKNAAITQSETATTESADARLARIDKERAAVRADRDALVRGARESMNLVLDDGNSKNDDVSQYEANIRQYETDAKAKLDLLDAQVTLIEGERLTAQQKATEQAVGDPGLATVFRFPARYVNGWDGITFRDAFSLFWVILLEAVGAFGAQALLTLQMAMSKRKAAQEAGSKGGRESAKAKMRKLITYAAQAQKGTKADMSAEKPDEDDEDDEPPVPKQAAE